MADRTITLRLEIDGREVEAKLRATDALVEQLQRHLADVGTTGQQAGRVAAAGLEAIEREIRSGTIVSIRQANDALRQLDALFEEATDDATRARIAALSQEVHALRGRMMGAATAIGTGFNPAAMQMVRIVQDAPYGFLAVANNLQELVTQLALSAKAGGGFRAALSSLVTGLIGPAGIVAALSALIAFGPQLWDWFSRLIGLSDDSAEALKQLRDEIAKLAETQLQQVFGELSVEELERLRAAQERLLETRRRSVELYDAEIDRLKARRNELQLQQGLVGLTPEQQQELARIQQRLADLEEMRRRATEELTRQEAVLGKIDERLEEARKEQQLQAELAERAAQAGVKTAEQKEKEAEAQEKARREAERARKEKEKEAEAARKLAERMAEVVANERVRQMLEAEREAMRGPDLPEPDLDFGEGLFVLADEVKRLMEAGVTAEDVTTRLQSNLDLVRKALEEARKELARLQDEGADTSAVEALIASLEGLEDKLTLLGRITGQVTEAMARTFAETAQAIGASLVGVQDAMQNLGTALQLIIADLAQSLAQTFMAMAAATAIANPGKAAALVAAAGILYAIAGALRAQASRRAETEDRTNPAVVTNRPGQAGGRGFQQGGWVPGSGRGDIVPALLEPGEYVVRRSVAQAWAPVLEQINRGADRLRVELDERSLLRLGERLSQEIRLRVVPGVLPAGDLRIAVKEAERRARRSGLL